MLIEAIDKKRIFLNFQAKNKEELIEKLFKKIYDNSDGIIIDYDLVLKEIWTREKSLSTGIGKGIALPHCESEKVSKLIIGAAVVNEGIDFKALDEELCYLFFMLIFVKGDKITHHSVLKGLSRILTDDNTRLSLIKSKDVNEFYDILIRNSKDEYFVLQKGKT